MMIYSQTKTLILGNRVLLIWWSSIFKSRDGKNVASSGLNFRMHTGATREFMVLRVTPRDPKINSISTATIFSRTFLGGQALFFLVILFVHSLLISMASHDQICQS
ncbi:uncharacterized protein A4U43_C10F15630 [Asparagus officinalis]|uniref:Uncharacterized protein n=1 Tax=Asparagus officinalis TaxID=4686 RepID=A0A5P1E387_ASPOF|nr:uncharacterized protein LOC109826233 [Asparagus officinalis]ONK57010.1 uncharacterized protein A4U43_C10F15630 [Asparagus officinalis]